MCPALIFAANRKDKVIGRTVILVVSISTKKGFNQSGAPPGSNPPKKLIGLLTNLDRIRLNHKTRPKDKVKIKCLVTLNLYGIKPCRFIKIMIRNKALNILENPLIKIPEVRDAW